MALLKPDIQKALRAANLTNVDGDESINELMDKKGLSPADIIDSLTDFINVSTNEPMRLKALETAAKMRGLLKPSEVAALPSITIVIKDTEPAPAIDPILIPRQAQQPHSGAGKVASSISYQSTAANGANKNAN